MALADKLADRERSIKKLHDSYMLEESRVARFLDEGMPYLELNKICLHGYITGRPIEEIAEMRKLYTWTRTFYLLGLTPESYAEGEKNYKADRISRLFGLDRELLVKYLHMGFASHQIKSAYFISMNTGKDILELLESKTRAKKWGDIAEEMGLPREGCKKIL